MAKGASKSVKEIKEKKGANTGATKRLVGVLVFIIVIVAAISGAIVYGLGSTSGTSITTFESNFNAAPNVAIVVYAKNNTSLGPPVDCASNLIEQLTSTHGSAHKNSTAINYYVMNMTTCSYTTHGLGSSTNTTTASSCLSMSLGVPTIFINYSTVNKTTITPQALYISGDLRFMVLCGVASEITAQTAQ